MSGESGMNNDKIDCDHYIMWHTRTQILQLLPLGSAAPTVDDGTVVGSGGIV